MEPVKDEPVKEEVVKKVVTLKKKVSKYDAFRSKLITKFGENEKEWPVHEVLALSKQPK